MGFFGIGGFKRESYEIQCRLCQGRIKLMRNKRTIQLQANRKEIANLLKTGKQEYARIKVEGVIRDQLMLQAYEILELYVELLSVRSQLVAQTKEIPRDMVEAISSLIYAAQRIGDLPELLKLRSMFEIKYGKEYVMEANNDASCSKWQVNNKLIRCLLIEPPSGEDKLHALSEIGQENGVEWDLSAAARDLLPSMAVVAPEPSIIGAPVEISVQQPHNAPGMPTPGTYENAHQAAAYAAYSAQQASAAAEYAAQFSLSQAGVPVPSEGWLAANSFPAVLGNPNHVQAPPPGVMGASHVQAPPPGPSHFPPVSGAPTNQGWQSPAMSTSSAGGADAPPYVKRSDEDIQRDYDNAPGGPPPKVATAPPPPPVPQMYSASDIPAPPGIPLNLPNPPSAFGLPAPPSTSVQPGAPSAKPSANDDVEALMKRLEDLKR